LRQLLLAAGLTIALDGPASAAPFAELPFRPVPGAAVCVRATGMPGELVRWTARGVELSIVRPEGSVASTTLDVGPVRECPVLVSDPGGFATLAAATTNGVRIAVREPSGAWTTPITVPAERAQGVQVAVSAGGDALVGWTERTDPESDDSTVHAVRRAPGGSFSEPQQLGGVSEDPEVAAGLAGDGQAVLAIAGGTSVAVTTAARDAAFAAPQRLGTKESYRTALALAVGADGRALLAARTTGGLALFERDPGAGFVRRPAVPADSGGSDDLAVALGPDGAAAVAWKSFGRLSVIRRAERSGDERSARGSGAAFGTPETADQTERSTNDSGAIVSFLFGASGTPPYDGRPALKTLLGADGRLLVTWASEDLTAYTTTFDAGSPPVVMRVGTALRDPQGLTPLMLADGTRAIAWSDNNAPLAGRAFAGRVHVAVEGRAEAAAAPAPELAVGVPRDRSLRPAQTLLLPVRCSAACDVRIESDERLFDAGATLTRAGTARMRIFPLSRPIAPVRLGPVKLRFVWSAPGSRVVSRRTVGVDLRRAPASRFPRLLDVRATRRPGGVVDVRWRTDVAARDVGFRIVGDIRRAARGDDNGLSTEGTAGNGRRSFHVELTRAARARYVRVNVYEYFGRRDRTVTVEVR